MCAVPGRVIFCSSSMLLAPRIFPKFWSIRSLISPSTPTTNGTVSVLIIIFIIIILYFVFVSCGTGGGILDQWKVRSFRCPLHTITGGTSNRLGLCDMYYVFYRLLSTTHFQKLVYLLRKNATKSWSTVIGIVQTTFDRLKQS